MMLVTRPNAVMFGGVMWESVVRVSIETSSVEMTEEWDDEGPNMMFADSTRRRTAVSVFQEIEGDDLASPDLGVEGTLSIELDRGNDADRRVVSMNVVVRGVSYSFSGPRSTRHVQLVAVSGSGDIEPVSVIGGV